MGLLIMMSLHTVSGTLIILEVVVPLVLEIVDDHCQDLQMRELP